MYMCIKWHLGDASENGDDNDMLRVTVLGEYRGGDIWAESWIMAGLIWESEKGKGISAKETEIIKI